MYICDLNNIVKISCAKCLFLPCVIKALLIVKKNTDQAKTWLDKYYLDLQQENQMFGELFFKV